MEDLTLLDLAHALSSVRFTEEVVLNALQGAKKDSAALINSENLGRYKVCPVVTLQGDAWALDLQIFDTYREPSRDKGHLVNVDVLLVTNGRIMLNSRQGDCATFRLEKPDYLINSSLRLVL